VPPVPEQTLLVINLWLEQPLACLVVCFDWSVLLYASLVHQVVSVLLILGHALED
jgi:hypothetical protein